MGFTPKFQEILDKVTLLQEQGNTLPEIQEFFQHSVRNLSVEERMNNLYRIRPKRVVSGQQSRMAFFTMNKMQQDFHRKLTNRDLILKMRQGGVTTYSCIRALDTCLWVDGSHAAIMAHVRDNVKKFFRITKSAFTQFQKDWGELYPITSSIDNVNELKFNENGSELTVCTETKGLTLDFLHISEACFVEDSRISESLESVPLSGNVIMESTPNTASGMFYEMWDLWSRGEMCTFKGHFYPWWFQYPEEEDLEGLKDKITKDLKLTDRERMLVDTHELTVEHMVWRRLKLSEAGGDEGEFQRKYPEDPMTCFLSGSSSVFQASVLAMLWRNERKPQSVGRLETL